MYSLLHTLTLILLQLIDVKRRIGVEGFVCLVRGHRGTVMEPFWYFTSPGMSEYLEATISKGWDTSDIAAQAECFLLGGSALLSAYISLFMLPSLSDCSTQTKFLAQKHDGSRHVSRTKFCPVSVSNMVP